MADLQDKSSENMPETEEAPESALPRAALLGEKPRFLDTRRGRAAEVFGVLVLVLAVYLPGLGGYSLVDPWETHYGEVARRMLQDDDLIHTQWQNEGFRSKPVLTPWLIAAGIRATGHGKDGGYSGEMTESTAIVVGARLPFVLFGALGLVLMWWMLARAVRRRVAWLALLFVGASPFYFLIARQSITDMPLVGSLMGALSCFIMALHAGDAPLERLWKRVNAYHLFVAALVAFVGWQIFYDAIYFYERPRLAHGIRFPSPHIVLPLTMTLGLLLFTLWSPLMNTVHWLAKTFWEPDPAYSPTRRKAMRVVGAILFKSISVLVPKSLCRPITTRRQLYMFWFYALLGVSVLAKGLPGIGIAGATCLVYVLLTNSWRQLADLEIPRGILVVLLVVVPWHLAMYLVDGRPFVRDYIITHNIRRATAGVHGERGTFDFFISQLGIGFWPWIALVPAAVASAVTGLIPGTREGRVRLIVGLWAVVAVGLFSMSQTKFHHYIFPAVPALGMLVAFWVDDLMSGRVRRATILLVGASVITLLVMRDLMGEQKQLIELFVYRYDRPWPSKAPWNIDLSDDIFALGLTFALLFPLLAVRKLRGIVLGAIALAGLVLTFWGTHVYMKHAGTHWGMRTAVREYYQKRRIYGQDIRYYSREQLARDWVGFDGTLRVESFIPDTMSAGQPMTVRIELMKNASAVETTYLLRGRLSDFGDHWFDIEIPADEVSKLPTTATNLPSRRYLHKPWRRVNADRLIAWQLYWRGENFWSGDEIFAESPDMKTAFKQTDNKEFLAYINAPERAGNRYFIMTESGRAKGLKNILPTKRGKATFEILNTDSNKFTLLTFSN